jgi:cell division protease FtsH
MSRRPGDLRPGQGKNPQKGGLPSGFGLPRWVLWAALLLILMLVFAPALLSRSGGKELGYNEFVNDVQAGKVAEVAIGQDGHIEGKLKAPPDGDGSTFTSTAPPQSTPDNALIQLLKDKNVKTTFPAPSSNVLAAILTWVFPIGLLFLFLWWMNRRAAGQMSGIMNIGRSRAKVYTTEKPRTTFEDVAGYRQTKNEVKEVIDFLKDPRRFKEVGARVPKGILLVGPPGTGKTLIARAVAGEAGVPFISITGSDFMEMFVGVGASRVRDLFQTARKQAPAIIFIDEIDSIGRKRGAGLGGGHDEREQTLNQLLSEMDGFEATEGIVIMAATNRPDILDPALLRPGRFDRQITVPLPTQEERLEILRVHTGDKTLDPSVDLVTVSRGTPGMSGADLSNLCNEAALYAVRSGRKYITRDDFDDARDRILMGQRRDSMAISESEKEIIAYHEGGHAVLAYLLPHADPLHKVTILPSGMALGVTQQLPLEERHIYQRHYIEDSLCVRMGGRAAELLIFETTSTGANNDLVGNTNLARKMVREWGMSDRIGPMAFGDEGGSVFLGEELVRGHEYSDETARVIDEEVSRILQEMDDRAMRVLNENRPALDALARLLLEKETVTGEEAGRIMDLALGRAAANRPEPAVDMGPGAAIEPDAAAVEVTPAPAEQPVTRRRRGLEPGPAFS